MKRLILTIALLLATTTAYSAPKYITQCKLYGNAGNAIQCDLVPNPQHVTPDVKWSSYRMHRDGLPTIETSKKSN